MEQTPQSPEEWMAPTMKVGVKNESIRSWYDRSTRGWRKALLYATIVAVIGAGLLYALASFQLLARMQTFCGAAIVPIGGLLWILSFVYIFLVPSREVGFRSQESIEEMLSVVRKTVDEQIVPAAQVWQRIGERVERELPRMIEDSRATLEETRATAKKLDKAIEKNEKFADEARPALEALKRIEARFEAEIKSGFIEEMRTAAASVRNLSGPPVKKATEPDLDWALASIKTKPRNP